MNDRKLIERILQGDSNLYAEVMGRYASYIYNKVVAVVKDMDMAQEVTQITFIKAYDRLELWRGQDLCGWLTSIAFHSALDALNKEKRRRGSPLNENKETTEQEEDSFQEEREQQLQKLEEAIRQLPAEERKLIEMHYYKKLKTEDIARQTGLTQTKIKKRQQRTREHIKKLMGGTKYD